MTEEVEMEAPDEVAQATAAEVADRDTAAVDRRLALQCHDERRFWSPAVTRAFTSAIRASSLGPQSEVSEPDEVTLFEPAADASDMGIIRGVD
jgi:hypothetical protein